jgi:deoxyribonuclease V
LSVDEEIFTFTDEANAVSFQRNMAARVVTVDEPGFDPRLICGIDVAYDDITAYAAAAVWNVRTKTFVEQTCQKDLVGLRYIPGLLGYREGPILAKVVHSLRSTPDTFLVDGQGIAHPRKFGLACHFGMGIDRPTVGVAKSRLYGKVQNGRVLDPDGNQIGRVVSDSRGKKFYVSVGHRISLYTATRLVESCIVNGHPAPLRQAHLDCEKSKRNREEL